jgi:hypothetical protein
MASHTLTLYMTSSSTSSLDGVPLSIDLMLESSYVREEARLIIEAPLVVMPPPSYTMSGGSSLKTTVHSKVPQGGTKEKNMVPTRPTTSAIGLKRKSPDLSGPSKRSLVTPSGNTVSHASSSYHTARPSLCYTMVGVCKPKEGMARRSCTSQLNS